MTIMAQRDRDICQEYLEGKEIQELARTYGVGDRRISQILTAAEIKRRSPRGRERKPLSRVHVRVGLKLYQHREDRQLQCTEVGNDLEMSAIRVRKIEKGLAPVELLDLQNLAAYLGVSIQELLEEQEW